MAARVTLGWLGRDNPGLTLALDLVRTAWARFASAPVTGLPQCEVALSAENECSDLCGRVFLHRRCHVRVQIKRDLDRRMSEAFLHDLRVDAGRERQRRVGVS